jgi:hypothetical protein
MANMDHSDATRLGATEKYLLGELSPSLRAEFEDHYFECSVCAADLEAASLFLAGSHQVLREAPVRARAEEAFSTPKGWLGWFRPAVVVPAFAVLLLLLGYQNFITLTHWQKLATSAASPRLLHPFYLHAGTSRSGEPAFQVPSGQPFEIFLDVPADSRYQDFLLRVENGSGLRRDLLTLPSAEAGKTSLIQMPADLTPGTYDLVVLGLPAVGSSSSASEITRASFVVEIPSGIEQH